MEMAVPWQDDGAQGSRDLTVQIACWVLVAVAGGLMFVPGINPLVMVLLALAPWVLLLMVFFGNGRYLMYGSRGQTVIIGVLVLPIVLGMSALLRFNIIDWRGATGPAIGMAVGFALLAWLADSSAVAARPDVILEKPRPGPFPMVISGAFLGWSMLTNLNAGVQMAPPAAQMQTIAHKWVSGGKSHTPYFTFVDAPPLGITNFTVSWALYHQSEPGDRVCLLVHTGLLGWRWYDVAPRRACGDPF